MHTYRPILAFAAILAVLALPPMQMGAHQGPGVVQEAVLQQSVSFKNPLLYIGQNGNAYLTDDSAGAGQPFTGDSSGGVKLEYPFFERTFAYGQFAWSPNTRALAFTERNTNALFVMFNGRRPTKVNNSIDTGFPPVFSQDGKELAYVVSTKTRTGQNDADLLMQIQAVTAAGGQPRAVGSLVGVNWNCAVPENPAPDEGSYHAEIGVPNTSPMFLAWLKQGFLHSLSCDGSGLALSDGTKVIWQNPALQNAALSPDGTQLAAILIDPKRDLSNQLNLVDPVTGATTPIKTEPGVDRAIFSPDGRTLIYSTVTAGRRVAGEATNETGAKLFGSRWPVEGPENEIAIWSVPVAGGTSLQLYRGVGRGVGYITVARHKPVVAFSLVTSLAAMVESINGGEPLNKVYQAAPHLEVIAAGLDGGGTPVTLARGGNPIYLPIDQFTILSEQAAVALPTAMPLPVSTATATLAIAAQPTGTASATKAGPTATTGAGAATAATAAPTIVPTTALSPTPQPSPTLTLIPSATAAVILTPLPNNQCPGFLPSRLKEGGRGRVLTFQPQRIRASAPNGTIVGVIQPGGAFDVLEGPLCTDNNIAWWRVRVGTVVGWTPEGQGTAYWVEPLTITTPTATPGGIQVLSVTTRVDPATSATCPTNATFTAQITVSRGGTITYRWERSDGTIGPTQTLAFTDAQTTREVTAAWNLGTSGPFWQRLHVLTPNDITSNLATVAMTCGGAAFKVIVLTASVSPSGPGDCPRQFNFTGFITTNGAGSVTYRWEGSDGSIGTTQTKIFNAPGTQSVTFPWKPTGSGAFWQRLRVLTPNDAVSNQAEFTQTCP